MMGSRNDLSISGDIYRAICDKISLDEQRIAGLEESQRAQERNLRDITGKIDDIQHQIILLHSDFTAMYKWIAGIAIAWILQVILTIGLLER